MPAFAKTERSRAQRDAFQQQHPCPATGKTHGACKGYVVDHVVPLCAGGADSPRNMQWQTAADAKVKDRAERAQCRR
ncbi:MAG: HNH endonuclease [Ideonella sp.]|nr:HNH endonuclease [Ideonella sp.]